MYEAITDEQSTAVVQRAIESGLNYFDTAPLYGQGLSEPDWVGRSRRCPGTVSLSLPR